MELLLVGMSRFARRRVLPAAVAMSEITRTTIASSRHSAADIGNWPKLGRVFSDWREAMAALEPCLVYVSLVNGEHEDAVTRALELGHHVVVDKPALLNLDAAERAVGLARDASLVIAEATCYSHHPLFPAVAEIFERRGSRVTRAVAVFTPPVPAADFRYDRRLGGGALYDTGPYVASLGRVLWGKEPVSINVVVGDRTADGVETSYSVLAEYSNGKILIGHLGFTMAYHNSLKLIGRTCVADIDRPFSALAEEDVGIRVASDGEVSVRRVPATDSMCVFLARVIRAALNRTREFDSQLLSDARTLDRLVRAARS
jgi:predicted dehydrogenase